MMVIKILGLDKQGRKGAESLINASKAQSKLPREQAFTYIWPAALKKKKTPFLLTVSPGMSQLPNEMLP